MNSSHKGIYTAHTLFYHRWMYSNKKNESSSSFSLSLSLCPDKRYDPLCSFFFLLFLWFVYNEQTSFISQISTFPECEHFINIYLYMCTKYKKSICSSHWMYPSENNLKRLVSSIDVIFEWLTPATIANELYIT